MAVAVAAWATPLKACSESHSIEAFKFRRFAQDLLHWYHREGRHDLPWQGKDAYRVWISEIMLQQTQVASVIAYFQAFTQRFPDLATLAAANEDEVLAQWSGLGYYSRARNLHKAAIQLLTEHRGELPNCPQSLASLPGIGRSTAAAICAQAYGQRAAILDGNVKRVLSRVHRVEGDPSRSHTLKRLWTLAEQHTPEQDLADYSQAIMDLGATVCRRQPSCEQCPVQSHCQAHQHRDTHLYPNKRPRKTRPERHCWMLLIQNRDEQLLLQQRPAQGVWPRLWSLPQLERQTEKPLNQAIIAEHCSSALKLKPKQISLGQAFHHDFSHYRLNIQVLHIQAEPTPDHIAESASERWLTPSKALSLGLPAPVRSLITTKSP